MRVHDVKGWEANRLTAARHMKRGVSWASNLFVEAVRISRDEGGHLEEGVRISR